MEQMPGQDSTTDFAKKRGKQKRLSLDEYAASLLQWLPSGIAASRAFQKTAVAAAAVGFKPTPPKRLEPKSSALDRSATLPPCLPAPMEQMPGQDSTTDFAKKRGKQKRLSLDEYAASLLQWLPSGIAASRAFQKTALAAVGFEPTPPKRLEP
ncbi:hypothetical protein Q8A67_020829 [Cirrhinus molitorella]|uniref:Uncharacterized protein n=1 Tax=Cirrhinus molitorella TaxID=172907 RepID=A0AA88PCM0_9TELE|nr:hypothetical protein Q8A67_020829 [Cirrhinus molitorella]